MMIAFEGISVRSAHAQSWYRRPAVAVVAFLVAIVAAALTSVNGTSVNSPASSPSTSVLACGSSPGPCLISSKLAYRNGGLNLDV
jgi:hypothetical protein